MKSTVCLIIIMAMALTSAWAGEAEVVKATVQKQGDGRYAFTVTVRHADTGWDHYADKWDIVSPDGTVLGTRTLYHPHVEEQPFTRSLQDVDIDPEFKHVRVRAHDSVHGYGGKSTLVALP